MSTATDEQVVLDVDLDLVLPCNVRREEECPFPAEWVYHCAGCGHASQPCTKHRIKLDRWLATYSRIATIRCLHCTTAIPVPCPWSAI